MRSSVRFLAAAALAWLGACADAPTTTPSASAPDVAARPAAAWTDARDRYIVVFEDRVARPADEAREMVRGHRGTLHFTYEHAVRGFAATLTPQAAEALRRNPNVRSVEPDQVVRAAATQTGAPSSLDRIDQRSLPLSGSYTYGAGATGQGVNAYVVDSGIRFSHAQFGGRAVPAVDLVLDDQAMGNDCTGHGTHVAGILGGSTYGVAKGVKLHSVRVINCYNEALMSAVVAGLDWVRVNHVKPAVVNLGFTGLYSLAQDDAVKALLAAGVTVVSPAGNSNDDVCFYSSAYIDGVITAGATDATDTRWPFSNWGHCIDVFAPGTEITSAAHYGDTDVTVLSGTSMAAPHVSGAVARFLQTKANATPAEAHAFIVNNATAGVVSDPGYLSPNRLLYVNPALGNVTTTITGTSNAATAGSYTWLANAGGGNGTFTYAWEYRVQGSATWTAVGTGSSYTRSVAAGNPAFELRVTVTSGGASASDNHLVAVTIPTVPPPAVTIGGITAISTAGTHTWTTTASGGNGTFTYAWEYRVQGGTWTSVGTASSYSRSVAAGNPAFELRVTVTSGGLTGSDTHLVSVTIPTPLAANITGPNYLEPGFADTWHANASGGTGSYTYQWQYRLASSTTWSNVGMLSSYTRSAPRQSFYLRVTVTSGGVSVVDDHFVEVWVEPMCGQYLC